MSTPILAWWIAPDDMLMSHGDGRPVVMGETVTVEPPLELCKRGLHASLLPLDALAYRKGRNVVRVELSGEMLCGTDKLCAQHRKHLWVVDAQKLLVEFSCWCARRAILVAHMIDPQVLACVETVDRWLRGEATLGEVLIARNAAHAAADAPASAAAYAASAAAAAYAAAYAAYAYADAADARAKMHRDCAAAVRAVISFETVWQRIESQP